VSGFARGATDTTEQALDPEKIFLRHALRQRAEKRPIAAAKIDMQWRFASENFPQIKSDRD
jgi:hypothetical protein